MTIDETKYLMEALENVKERDRIIECNTIDRVLEIIDDMCRDDETGMRIDLGIQWLHAKTVREKIAALKEGEQK